MSNQDYQFRHYIRVGVKYYKLRVGKDAIGVERNEIIAWSKENILDDFGKEFLKSVEKFDGFINFPDNINFKQVVGGKYNTYQPMSFKPVNKEAYKEPSVTLEFLKHVFGDKYEIGLKYLNVLYTNPRQKLPILALVSKERSTGKSTFIDYVNTVFGENAVVLDPASLKSAFNSSYSNKLVISIEETEFQDKTVSERLKALATQNKISVNTKMVAEYNTGFFGKIILASNNEDKFSIVKEDEIRYFVVKVPTINDANVNILNDLTEEIPDFLRYLVEMEKVEVKSRMVFTPEEIRTEALKVVNNESKSTLAKDLEIILNDLGARNPSEKQLMFTVSDVKGLFKDKNYGLHYIKRVLSEELGLTRGVSNVFYKSIHDLNADRKEKRGFVYVYDNPHFEADFISRIV